MTLQNPPVKWKVTVEIEQQPMGITKEPELPTPKGLLIADYIGRDTFGSPIIFSENAFKKEDPVLEQKPKTIEEQTKKEPLGLFAQPLTPYDLWQIAQKIQKGEKLRPELLEKYNKQGGFSAEAKKILDGGEIEHEE